MKRFILYLALTAILAAGLSPTVVAQNPARMFGTSTTGAAVPLLAAADGSLMVTMPSGPLTGMTDITFASTAGTLRTGTAASDTLAVQAYDVDGAAYASLITLTAGNTPTVALVGLTGAITPAASDGAALGTGALAFSDLFLASGAVINFNNGDVTVTHSSALLTISDPITATAFNTASATIGDASNGQYTSKGWHVGGTSDPGDNNLLVDGTGKFGATVATQIYIPDDGTINGAFGNNSDSGTLWLNYNGYLGGNTYFRDTKIGDGKNAAIATFTGSTKLTTLAGALNVSGATITAPAYVVGATAGADCTSATAVTVAKGIVTACSAPAATPDELLSMIADLRAELASLKARQ